MENKFFDSPKGLKCKYVFLENDFPIFFSCTDDYNNDYLGCYSAVEDNHLKFTISKVSPLTILKVLRNEMFLYDAFKNSQYNYIYTLKESTEVEIVNQVEDKYLPVKEEYLDAEPGEFEEEANAYLFKCYRESFILLNNIEKRIRISHLNPKCDYSSFNVYSNFKPNQLGGLNATKSA